MQRRTFSREYRLEIVRLVRDRSVGWLSWRWILDFMRILLRKRVKDYGADHGHAFLGHGHMKPSEFAKAAASAQAKAIDAKILDVNRASRLCITRPKGIIIHQNELRAG